MITDENKYEKGMPDKEIIKEIEQDEKEKISIGVPVAIIVAGALIAGAILLSGSYRGGSIGLLEKDGAKNVEDIAQKLKKGTITEEVGLDKKAFASCLESGKYAAKVESDYQSGVTVGVQGTPHSVVLNVKTGKTYIIGGAMPLTATQSIISSALAGKSDGSVKTTVNPVTPNEHIKGNPNAEVFVIEYSDPECPFCKRFHETMKSVMQEYGDTGKVAWVYRHFPLDALHTKARKEAEAFECAAELGGNVKFWEYADKLFEITPSNDGLDPKLL